MSPPHGGFNPDDPNQQIVAEDIFDEYGGEIFVSYKKTQWVDMMVYLEYKPFSSYVQDSLVSLSYLSC